MRARISGGLFAAALAAVAVGVLTPLAAQAPARSGGWVVPRTADGRPDLQGNWTNATITPIQRPEGQGPTLTPEEVRRIETNRASRIEEEAQATDPDRPAPPVGGDGSSGAAGGVGGYNYFWIDAGDRVAIYNGQARTSLITNPESGRRPALLPAAQQRIAAARRNAPQFGQYDNPENRPMAERCIISFGANLGPPMMPNYFYNNNYTIVQTPDHVMIMTEMVHDTRVISLGERPSVPAHVRPYGGVSWGRWVGDTLVVETTNIHPEQDIVGVAPTEATRVIERFTRADERTINYEFTVIDPTTYAQPWGGEVPYTRLEGQVYEYACHEGNYALGNVLSGARAQERQAAQAGASGSR